MSFVYILSYIYGATRLSHRIYGLMKGTVSYMEICTLLHSALSTSWVGCWRGWEKTTTWTVNDFYGKLLRVLAYHRKLSSKCY